MLLLLFIGRIGACGIEALNQLIAAAAASSVFNGAWQGRLGVDVVVHVVVVLVERLSRRAGRRGGGDSAAGRARA